VCSRPNLQTEEEPIVFVSTREVVSGFGDMGAEEEREDSTSAMVEDLATYVFRQIAPDVPAEDRKMAAHLLTNLDEDGLLQVDLEDVASYFHVSLKRVESLQRLIQHADPIGVGSSSPKEAMLMQLEVLKETQPVPAKASEVIEQSLEMLSRRQYIELAKIHKLSVEKIRQIAHFISDNLNPFPGRSYWGDMRQPSAPLAQVYYRPDIIISRLNETDQTTLMVEILFPLWGTLRVNPLYRQAIQVAMEDQKDAMREDMERASLFVKCLQQRNHTMQRLMQRIASLQRNFILNGDKYLRPITRASLAKELEVHESTISRAVANKAVQLPNGRIIPLSDFFDRSLSARIVLKELISSEMRPLSDSELVHMLAERGYEVARRTVAKYRAMEGILPANLRRPC
jgi:RNA polymerase sigma-54 factor